MKKILVLLLSICLILNLSACVKENTTTNENISQTVSNTDTSSQQKNSSFTTNENTRGRFCVLV